MQQRAQSDVWGQNHTHASTMLQRREKLKGSQRVSGADRSRHLTYGSIDPFKSIGGRPLALIRCTLRKRGWKERRLAARSMTSVWSGSARGDSCSALAPSLDRTYLPITSSFDVALGSCAAFAAKAPSISFQCCPVKASAMRR